ncbi:Spermatogenesis-associated protein 22 [Larimichthys crocea]|uniref:Uncharacterized protein n=1 Tax=Larimichthys crocea TaxID=215358 RepID=A0ACD3R2Q3_LARCR|nr:Spermatogenesis-associated protein 22 [Larimichthys crocea]
MRRHENQPPRPSAGCLPVPIFNQKKRIRVPLTSAPSENEFFSHSEFTASAGSAASHSTSGTYGSYQGLRSVLWGTPKPPMEADRASLNLLHPSSNSSMAATDLLLNLSLQ